MKRGTKRGAFSDSSPDLGDSPVQDKRAMPTNFFNAREGTFSTQKSVAKPTVDMQRVELAHRHVTALNKQFASWVQSQLLNHPEELWEDGVRDYLTHASGIMEKFSDVVAWLQEKSPLKAESTMVSSLPTRKPSFLEGVKSSTVPNMQLPGGAALESSSTSTQNLWSSNLLSSRQSSVSNGDQGPPQTNSETAPDPDEETEVNEPRSPSVKKTEEQGVVTVHEVKCKVYIKPDNPADKSWKDIGIGMLSIKCKEGVAKATKESKPNIIIRNDVGKPLLNALIYPGIKLNIQKNTIASIFHTSGPVDANGDAGSVAAAVARTFLLRMRTEDDTKKLAEAIQEYAPTT